MMVKWNISLPSKFDVTNGVKQGGVLSPLLFTVYLNDLLCQLRDHNTGCQMNSHFVGAVIYADDITLLGLTYNSVMALLDIMHTIMILINDINCCLAIVLMHIDPNCGIFMISL